MSWHVQRDIRLFCVERRELSRMNECMNSEIDFVLWPVKIAILYSFSTLYHLLQLYNATIMVSLYCCLRIYICTMFILSEPEELCALNLFLMALTPNQHDLCKWLPTSDGRYYPFLPTRRVLVVYSP